VEDLEAMEAFAASTQDPAAVGGMRTKLEAARRAASYAIPTVIARGREPEVLLRLARGERLGTLVRPKARRLAARKHWIAYALKPRGAITVDAGAYRAIVERGKSLLPSGVVAVEGRFEVGEAVELRAPDGRPFARGLVAYGARELRRIQGKRTDEIEELLGYKYRDEVIHRDDLVLLEGREGLS
jgi:glutamate 5-kinase